MASRILLIGIGNTLMGDDGVGVRVAELAAADERFAGVEVLVRTQLTPELAVDFAGASLVILVDASIEVSPGAIAVREVEAGPGATGAFSHHVAPEDLLALAAELYRQHPRAYVVSVGAASFDAGDELSPLVRAALPGAVDAMAGVK